MIDDMAGRFRGGGDDTIELRHLTILQARGNQWIVQEGLNTGDRIVLEGSQKVAPGVKVRPEMMDQIAEAPQPANDAGR